MPAFHRYIGIDYSGAATPSSSLTGLRIYRALHNAPPTELKPPPGPRKHWTRRALADCLLTLLSQNIPTLVGIDHGFSFPLAYFTKYDLPPDWPTFLDDFHHHWPTDQDISVDFVRNGICGQGAARTGESTWRRMTEIRTRRAKSVFHFDVHGSVAKSTHSGLPWLRYLRLHTAARVHFWPFDGWQVLPGLSAVAEVYPALWSKTFPQHTRNGHQQDAYSVAAWLREADLTGTLDRFLAPTLNPEEQRIAQMEGWILGVV